MKKCIGALGILMISLIVSACSDKENSSALFTVGGVVGGSTGTLVLQNNGGSDLTVTANGPFAFPAAAASGSHYSVTVHTNPTGQTCIVSNGTGTILVSNVTNVSVDCSARGGLDVTFNSPNGFATMNDAAGGNGTDVGNAVAVDSQGRILVTGSSATTGGTTDMVVWRFNADGTLDTTFNGTGIVVYDSGFGDDIGKAVIVDSQDRIMVAGLIGNSLGHWDMATWRYNADGTPDTTFHGTGIVTYNSAAGDNYYVGNGLVIDSQARIIVAGTGLNSSSNYDMVVWRFNANGTFDTAFGGGDGIVVHSEGGGAYSDAPSAVALDSQGRIVVAGYLGTSVTNTDMMISRLTTTGVLDKTFNGSGMVTSNSAAGGNGYDFGKALAIDPQGRIVVTGYSTNIMGNTDMVIWRYKSDGTPDTTFNGSGIVISNGAAGRDGDDSGNGIAIDSQGRILLTGSSTNSAGNTDMVVWRFNADGSLDITFADYGIFVHNNAAGGNGNDSANGIAVDSHDKILAGGSSWNNAGNADMAVWRVFP